MSDNHIWTVTRGSYGASKVTANHIAYTETHVVFKDFRGTTVVAYRAIDVSSIVRQGPAA
jgi:hypothetical protein